MYIFMFEVSWVWSILPYPCQSSSFFHISFPGVHFFTLMPTVYHYIFSLFVSLFPFSFFVVVAIFPRVVVAFCCQQTIQLLCLWGWVGVYHTDFFLWSHIHRSVYCKLCQFFLFFSFLFCCCPVKPTLTPVVVGQFKMELNCWEICDGFLQFQDIYVSFPL